MTVTETDILEIQTKVHPLLGKSAWGVSLGVGSFITLEFGVPLPYNKTPERFHGEWHLWITHSAWRLEIESEIVVGSEDPRPKLKKALQHLNNRVLRLITLTPPALETTLVFDKGIVLRLFPIYTEEFEHWMLYTPDGNVLSIGPGNRWSYTSSSEP